MKLKKRDDTIVNLKSEIRELQYQSDCSLQYSMRPNLKITGIKYEKEENLKDKVIDLCKDIGVTIKEEDISVTHRVGTREDPSDTSDNNQKIPTIIAKFVRRETRNKVFDARKALHSHSTRTSVYISDHVTPLRSRMMYELRNRGNKTAFKYVWSREGRIYARKPEEVNQRNPADQPKPHIINRPEDLKKLGWTDEEILNIIENKR